MAPSGKNNYVKVCFELFSTANTSSRVAGRNERNSVQNGSCSFGYVEFNLTKTEVMFVTLTTNEPFAFCRISITEQRLRILATHGVCLHYLSHKIISTHNFAYIVNLLSIIITQKAAIALTNSVKKQNCTIFHSS